ncbi:hypothetical protein Cpap_0198 [Ruminiclostridium papyrosolvens DSM 2782]|uniref:Uncharacterized protein n=1 Tax=Ruminiclostridium papyrosolvens DSM 2782 TaxID=588581 RepID=F1TIL2_9FIRM|nr:hypothetical protein [Ruminiclostridium papyrosolvens]EGD45829.1 hypothetical protein Cpap_0198 [Ruminiclostridium papyrosolvens DSM 2782]
MNTSIAIERMQEVIRTDVITSSEADFLATHVAFKNVKVIKGGEKEVGDRFKLDTEENIYKKYIVNKENKHQLIIVRGPSGAGKSHLIRWFAARIKQSKLENEEILFIRRSDNNLKGTIKQLLALDAVSNIPNKDIIERLLKATVTVDDNKFRDMIYQNFIVEIKNDDSTEVLSTVTKKNLEALLQNDMFQERLKHVGGPIDRIYAKVSSKDSGGYKDVVALFEKDDFLIDIDFCRELEKRGADRKAIKIANKIPVEEEIAADIAKYLNTFVDQVIQSCAGIEPGDFEQIFKDIRHELKLAGKNLILLIEDITAFTGINKALLNVLTTEHTGMYESQELCRISSIVGTTDAYYDEFRDNYKDRITNQFVIPDNVFGNNQDDLFEFVARYINAMSLPKSNIENWVKEGCVSSEYPVSSDNFDERWDFYEFTNGRKISFYPFSRNAIINLYAALQLKTPRNFLREIIEKVVNDILYNKKSFPGFQCTYLPNWNPINHGHVLADEITDEIVLNRIEKFIRIWGNANLFRTEENGIEYLGGIHIGIFEDLNMPVARGIKTTEKKASPHSNANKGITNLQDPAQKNINIGKDKTQNKIEISVEDKLFQEERKNVEVWLAGGTYSSFRKVRDDICDYLVTAINWQSEGVSYDAVMRVIRSRNLIGFERQKRASNENLVNLPANRETQEIIEAFLAWRILGNCKWSFNGAVYMQYRVAMWTQKIKDDLIRSILEVDGKELDYFKCACTAEIYRLILLGLNGGSTLNCITRDLVIGKNIKKSKTIPM